MIKRLEVSNFKSFKKLELNLDKFNVLIGSNASGKSNFVEIFQFLRDIQRFGLNDAISLLGGVEYFRNVNIGSEEPFSLKVVFDIANPVIWGFARGKKGIKINELIYEISIDFKNEESKFKILKERIVYDCSFIKPEQKKGNKKTEEKEELGKGKIIISRENEKINFEFNKPEEIQISEKDIPIPLDFLKKEKIPDGVSILDLFDILLLSFLSPSSPFDISIYNFDPKSSKKATPYTGKTKLEEDGSNLSLVIRNVLQDEREKKKILNLTNNILPFLSDMKVEEIPIDQKLILKTKEEYNKEYLPSFSLSDGTMNVIGYLIILNSHKNPDSTLIIEEPERNIHPFIISKLINRMKEASNAKQIIITTHNPEILKHVNMENILLVSRDKDGFSTISRPKEKREVQIFLENEIGIEELFVKNLLR